MQQILEIFSTKIIGNLMNSADKITDENLRIVDLTLEIFSQYLLNTVACRQLSQIPVVK